MTAITSSTVLGGARIDLRAITASACGPEVAPGAKFVVQPENEHCENRLHNRRFDAGGGSRTLTPPLGGS
jgi:hypothetical protein